MKEIVPKKNRPRGNRLLDRFQLLVAVCSRAKPETARQDLACETGTHVNDLLNQPVSRSVGRSGYSFYVKKRSDTWTRDDEESVRSSAARKSQRVAVAGT